MTARAVALDTLRALTGDELAAHLREQRGQLFQVRLQQTIGQVENHREIRNIRNEIARTMTVQVEQRLAAERGEVAPAPTAPAALGRRGRRAPATEPAEPPGRRRRPRTAAAPAVAVDDVAAGEQQPELEAISDLTVERVADAGTADVEADGVASETIDEAGGSEAAADHEDKT
jgi:ribosomal protein L29